MKRIICEKKQNQQIKKYYSDPEYRDAIIKYNIDYYHNVFKFKIKAH